MTVSMRVMSAGDGYKYLLCTVAAGDGDRSLTPPLTRYYAEQGSPPGRRVGQGLGGIGAGQLSTGDQVTEAQLQLLVGMGRDPITGDPLGHAYQSFVPVSERIEARVAELDGSLSPAVRAEQVAQIEAEEIKRGTRRAVAGFDYTFSVLKSASVLWAVADAGTQALIAQAHHAAIAGANVAIVCTAALLLCRAVQLGPRVQTGAALGALVVYILLVGTEPSVLRAGVTGVVGLVAVVASSRMQPVHALAIAVIVLLLLQPHLAVAYGFALSVAATFGIVVLTPLLARPLIRAGWPPVLARAVAVAVAADVVTMPIISLMTGEVSVVSVVANILVAPAAAPVTVLGILAALLSLVPGPLAVPVLWLAAPCTGWIHTVASACASLPVVTVKLDPFAVLVGYGWIIAGIICRRLILTGGALAVAAAFLLLPHPLPAQLDPAELETATIATLDAVDEVPAGTQLIVVLDPSGTPAERPTVTRDGVPVLFPNRDGAVTLHVDGSQHAQDGRF